MMVKIDRDLVISEDKFPTQLLPSKASKSKKRRREDFNEEAHEEECKMLSFNNDSNLSLSRKFKGSEQASPDAEDLIQNLVIGQCKPVSAARRRISSETFEEGNRMVTLKMIAANLKPEKFKIICTLLNDYVTANKLPQRIEYILKEYEIPEVYVEFILRQILSWGAKKGDRRIEGATEWDAEVLLSNEAYFLTQRDFACL